MKKLFAALSAVLLVFTAGCGHDSGDIPEQPESSSQVTEAAETTENTDIPEEAEENTTPAETEEAAAEETDDTSDTGDIAEKDYSSEPVGEMPDDISTQLRGQLAALHSADFEQWAESIDFDTVMDMMSEDIDPDEDDAQAYYFVMTQLADSFDRAAQTLPEEFYALNVQDISISGITFEGTDKDGGINADLYYGAIDGTGLLVKLAVYHYYGKDIPWVYDVVYDEPIGKDTAMEAAKMVYRAAMSSLPNGEDDLEGFEPQYIDCSDPTQELALASGDGTTYGFGYMLSEMLDGLEPKGQAYIYTMEIPTGNSLIVQWRADENAKTIAQYPVHGSRTVITWGEAVYDYGEQN